MSSNEENILNERIEIRNENGLDLYFISYDGLQTNEMIYVLDRLINLTKKNPIPFIADFRNTKIYPSYLVKGNEWINATKSLIPFGAFIGLDSYKSFLLESIVSINGLKHKHFKTYEDAVEAILEFYS